MKNIHILPTDKETRLFTSESELILAGYPKTAFKTGKSIYITNDEEIKDDDWVYCPVLKKPVFICLDSILMFKNLGYDSKGNSVYKKEWLKKIILTTDQDLIADGVQAIDDEFLEWFVKNPTCEKVEVVKEMYMPQSNGKISDGKITHELSLNPSDNTLPFYKIIIPQEEPKKFGDSFEDLANVMSMANFMFGVKEEPKPRHQQIIDAVGGEDRFREIAGIKPKQETLEEAAVRIAYDSIEENKGFPQMKAFINGAKWQAERMYSEEDMKLSFETGRNFQLTGENNFNELIEQFKNK
jgi:hypothetical protein